MKEGNPIISNLLKAREFDIGIISTPLLYPPRMTIEEANGIPWEDFKTRLRPFATVQHEKSDVEYIFSPKSPTWTYKDINVFVGAPDRKIATIADLTDEEGLFLFDVHLQTARDILNPEDKESHFSFGFNEEDLLPGHHSIYSRLHSHIYVSDNQRIHDNRDSVAFRDLSWFERLSLVEPTIPLFHDYMRKKIDEGFCADYLQDDKIGVNPGYLSVNLKDDDNTFQSFPDIRSFFVDVRDEYRKVEALFTDRQEDPNTKRYIPYSSTDRKTRVDSYIDSNMSWLSEESSSLLSYLGNNIGEAEERHPDRKHIQNAGNFWFTKGFAGAMNFAVFHDRDQIRFDFVPCALTTSSMNKVLIKEGLPTLLRRGADAATDTDQEYAASYYDGVQELLLKNFPEQTTIS